MTLTKSKTFCIFPFISMVTTNSGELCICCRSSGVGDVTKDSLLDTWNNDNMKRIRLELLRGEKPKECDGCWRHENIGIHSKRTRNLDLEKTETAYYKFKGAEEKMLPDGTMPINPQIIEIRVNNLCNLKCRMCNPLDSSSWNDWTDVKEIVRKHTPQTVELVEKFNLEKRPLLDTLNENFYQDLAKIIPSLKIVEFSGGEPLTNPAHYRILQMFMPYAKNIELKYDTNFLNLSYKQTNLTDIWNNFKGIKLNVSVDGIGEVYNYVRSNGDFSILKKNLDYIYSYKNLRRLVLASATSIYNVHDMVNVTRLAASYNAAHHMCKVSFPVFLSCQVLPTSEKNKIAKDLENFITEIPKLYENTEIKDYMIAQYWDLIKFMQVSADPNLLNDFIEYDTRLNKSRNYNDSFIKWLHSSNK